MVSSMSRAIRLRAWQAEALDRLDRHPGKDFLAVATPGAGKTTFALTAVVRDLAAHPHRRVIIVAPTSHLKVQWADAAASLSGLQLEPEWSVSDGWPEDMHGVVATYQQVAANPRAFRGPSNDAIVVLDEVHHAGTDKAWGDSLVVAFENAAM
ncbi:MAG: superfamily II DNA or RNA helicase, partial [Glaciecola sp.]